MALQPYLLNEMLKIAEQQPLSGHTPGHKNGLFLPARLKELWGEQFAAYDFTELPGLDNLHFSEECLAKSQQQTADFFGAAHSYYLVNGTTAGLQAAIMAACHEQEVFVPRHVHRSIYHSLILAQAKPIYLPVTIDDETSLPLGLDPAVLADYIKRYPNCKCLIMVHPTYQGLTWQNKNCFTLAKENKLTIIVDEAHGSHLQFNRHLPTSALELGGDLVVQSWHKTLPVLTQGSVLHVSKNYQGPNLSPYLSLLQTTSPSYLLMASLEMGGIEMMEKGEEIIENSLYNIVYLHQQIHQTLNNIHLLWRSDWQQDMIKLYLYADVLTGAELEAQLREQFAIYPEMHDNNGCLIMLPLNLTKDYTNQLLQALTAIDQQSASLEPIAYSPNFYTTDLPEEVIPLSEAFYAAKETILWQDAAGRIAGQFILRYPPGIPLLVPGERIEPELLTAWVNAGGNLTEKLLVLTEGV